MGVPRLPGPPAIHTLIIVLRELLQPWPQQTQTQNLSISWQIEQTYLYALILSPMNINLLFSLTYIQHIYTHWSGRSAGAVYWTICFQHDDTHTWHSVSLCLSPPVSFAPFPLPFVFFFPLHRWVLENIWPFGSALVPLARLSTVVWKLFFRHLDFQEDVSRGQEEMFFWATVQTSGTKGATVCVYLKDCNT